MQNTLDQLEKDCDVIGLEVEKMLRKDEEVRARNSKASFRGYMLWSLALLPLVMWGLCLLDAAISKQKIQSLIPKHYYDLATQFFLVSIDRIYIQHFQIFHSKGSLNDSRKSPAKSVLD